jgi:putative transposase
MSDYRRYFVLGGTYFLTIVTYGRRPILTTEAGRKHLHNAIKKIRVRRPFIIFATVLLPDHWHLVMKLPPGDDKYSTRIKRIKEEFSKSWLADNLPEVPVTGSQQERGERGIWQPRFWEHAVTDEDDLIRCVDYIHWNPRKHEVATRVRDWKWSSFHRFVKSGDYEIDWGGTEPDSIANGLRDDWGE